MMLLITREQQQLNHIPTENRPTAEMSSAQARSIMCTEENGVIIERTRTASTHQTVAGA
jgi:hypothetical protein